MLGTARAATSIRHASIIICFDSVAIIGQAREPWRPCPWASGPFVCLFS